jgi:hypothetical protein
MFTSSALGDLDLAQTADGQVVGQMQPPVIPCPAWMAAAAGIDKQDTPLWAAAQRVGGAVVATNALRSHSSQGLLVWRRLRHAASEIAAPPPAPPNRGVDRGPRTYARRPRSRSYGVASLRTRWNALSVRACAARGAGKRGTTSVAQVTCHQEWLCRGDGIGMMGEDQHRHLL